jgi:antirestriction protein ArdC
MEEIMDLYQQVTDKIVSALESVESGSWKAPWNAANGFPVNGDTGRPYSGVNVLLLWISAAENGFSSNEWYTFKQAQKAKPAEGYEGKPSVRKGEKGTRIIFFKPVAKSWKDKDGNVVKNPTADQKKNLKGEFFPLLRGYTVFNRDQIEGLPEVPRKEADFAVREDIEAFIKTCQQDHGMQLEFKGGRACYTPATDVITLPPVKEFHNEKGLYATLFHEMTHWTGHKDRLNRDLTGRFGSESYAIEELVAEMGSAFLCSRFDVPSTLEHAQYIKEWIKILKGDKYAVFTASREAKNASEFLLGEKEETEAEAA